MLWLLEVYFFLSFENCYDLFKSQKNCKCLIVKLLIMKNYIYHLKTLARLKIVVLKK